VTFSIVARDANGVLAGIPVKAAAVSGTLRVIPTATTSTITAGDGSATIVVTGGSGCGRLAVCADGVVLCTVEARSPDANRGAIPSLCGPGTCGTGGSFVNGADITNPLCGFVINFGTAIPGVNQCWDINCSGTVNGVDINAVPCVSGPGVIPHFGHGGASGLYPCPFLTCP